MKLIELFEATRVGQYFSQNPKKKIDYGISGPASAEVKDNRSWGWDSDPAIQKQMEKFVAGFKKKWQHLAGDLTMRKIPIWAIDDYNSSLDNIKHIKSPEEIKDSYFVDDGEGELLLPFFQKYLSELKNDFKTYEYLKSLARSGNKDRRDLKKSTRMGVSKYSYSAVMAWLKHYTASSYRKIPEEIWPAIQKLTVIQSQLPKVVYRGIFFDGAKIKDPDKWKTKWHVGSKPMVSQKKITSWSTSLGVATQFMIDQDNVKDRENGFHILLKYEIIDPSVVIADMRNLPDSRFWNQQEILLSPAAREYEVVKIIPYSKSEKEYHKFRSDHEKPMASMWGYELSDLIKQGFFKVLHMEIPNSVKEKIRILKDMTSLEAKAKLGVTQHWNDEVEPMAENLLFPLYSFMAKLRVVPQKIISKDKATAEFRIELPNQIYGSKYDPDKLYRILVDVLKPENKMNLQKDIPYGMMIGFNVDIELTRNNMNGFIFTIDNQSIVSSEQNRDRGNIDEKFPKFKKVIDAFNTIHKDALTDIFRTELKEMAKSLGVKVDIKF